MNKMNIILSTALGSMLLSGCGSYKAYENPVVETSQLYREYTDTTNIDTAGNFASIQWQEVFSDIYLQNLINQALTNNVDMQTAYLKVEQAEAALKAARLAFLPSFNFASQGTVSSWDANKAVQTYSLPVVASWEIDIFGRINNTKKRAQAVHEQSIEYTHAVQTWLVATVSNTYYTLLMLDAQYEISGKTAANWNESIQVMMALKEAGMTNEAAVAQSKSNYMAIQSSLLELKNQIYEVENTLCLLLGEAPHPIERSKIEDYELAADISVGLPIQLLTNRPDIRIAELVLQQSIYATKEARAACWPSLVLSGSAGWTNDVGVAVLNPGRFLAAAVGNLTVPIFNQGANKARVKIAKSQMEESYLNFEQTVLNAGGEVINALKQIETAQNKTDFRANQIQLLEQAVESTGLLMKHSNSTYLEVLTAQQALLSAQLSQVADKFDMVQGTINLYHALGGGQTQSAQELAELNQAVSKNEIISSHSRGY